MFIRLITKLSPGFCGYERARQSLYRTITIKLPVFPLGSSLSWFEDIHRLTWIPAHSPWMRCSITSLMQNQHSWGDNNACSRMRFAGCDQTGWGHLVSKPMNFLHMTNSVNTRSEVAILADATKFTKYTRLWIKCLSSGLQRETICVHGVNMGGSYRISPKVESKKLHNQLENSRALQTLILRQGISIASSIRGNSCLPF